MQVNRSSGFSLIELMVVAAIVVILTVLALPNFATWLQNSRTRTVAESLENGMRFAQTEAARLSRLTTITVSTTGWVVDYVAAANDQMQHPLQSSPATSLTNVSITPVGTTPAALTFSPLGRTGTINAGAFVQQAGDATYNVAMTTGASATSRQLNVVVSQGGKVRMCDPGKTFSDQYPDGCLLP